MIAKSFRAWQGHVAFSHQRVRVGRGSYHRIKAAEVVLNTCIHLTVSGLAGIVCGCAERFRS